MTEAFHSFCMVLSYLGLCISVPKCLTGSSLAVLAAVRQHVCLLVGYMQSYGQREEESTNAA